LSESSKPDVSSLIYRPDPNLCLVVWKIVSEDMAPLPRFILPGQPQHVIQRGNSRQTIFKKKDDYRFYLEKLGEAAEKHPCDIHPMY